MESHFIATKRAFDSVARDYDGPLGNNCLIQEMRALSMQMIERVFCSGARLLDLGCGTGIDAAYLTRRGYAVTAVDSSPAMVARARARLEQIGPGSHALNLGIHELGQLDGKPFDGAYSNFGALNCLPDLRPVSTALASKLKPGGLLVANVIGRYCPWEFLLYAARGNWRRATLRFRRGMVPVPLNGETVWTQYYTPREFVRVLAGEFEPVNVRALALFGPPPYLAHWAERFPGLRKVLASTDRLLDDKPFFRNAGDHFLMVLRKR